MPGGDEPVRDDLFEFRRCHAGMGGHENFPDPLLARGGKGLHVVFEDGLERLLGFPGRAPGREGLYPVHGKDKLNIDRLLAPERAVVVENRDAFLRSHELRTAGSGHAVHEFHDRLLRGPFIPGRKRGSGCGRVRGSQCHDKKQYEDSHPAANQEIVHTRSLLNCSFVFVNVN